MSSENKTVELYNWNFVGIPANPYQAPELWTQCFSGVVYGHPNFEDGTQITTSRVSKCWRDEEGREFIQTKNTQYELLAISPDYKRWVEENNFDLEKLFAEKENNEQPDNDPKEEI